MYRELISHTTSRSKEKRIRRTACPGPDENRSPQHQPLRSHIHRRKFVRTAPTRVYGYTPGAAGAAAF